MMYQFAAKDWAIGISGAILASEVLRRVYTVLNKALTGGEGECSDSKNVSEALFFPDDCTKTFKSSLCLIQQKRQAGEVAIDKQSNLGKVLHYIRSAKQSVVVCMYLLTCPEFGNVLIDCLTRGITVRVIVDFTSIQENGQEVNRLRRYGVPIRGRKQVHHMHHKFVVVDSALLLNGSFNWTQTAVTGNNENILITSNAELVAPFVEEFNRLWEFHKLVL